MDKFIAAITDIVLIVFLILSGASPRLDGLLRRMGMRTEDKPEQGGLLTALVVEIKDYQEQLIVLHKERQEDRARLTALEALVATLGTDLESEKAARLRAEKEVDELRGRVRRQDETIATLNASSAIKDAEIEALKQGRVEDHRRVEELAAKIKDLNEAKAASDTRATEAELKLAGVLETLKAQAVAEPRAHAAAPSSESPAPEETPQPETEGEAQE